VGALATDTSGERRILIVAGEPSGDLHASKLVAALRALGPCDVRGVAGPALRACGVQAVVRMEEIAVLGFAEVLGALPRILRARARLLEEVRRFRPHVACLVDFPGFNFRIAPALKREGVRVFYYIAPQVWAWHAERAGHMAAWTDRLAVVFPFEEELFRRAGVPVIFVGHPLMDELAPEVERDEFLAEIRHAAGPLLALLPGSRGQEIERHLPTMLAAARVLQAECSELTVVVPVAPGLDPRSLRAMAAAAGIDARVVEGRTRAVQAFSTAAAVASGTATLETALFATPLVVVYKISRLSFWLARRLVTLRRIGLPNIVAGTDVAPELIQEAFTAGALAAALRPLLTNPTARSEAARGLAIVRERLGEPGASERAAQLLWALAGAA